MPSEFKKLNIHKTNVKRMKDFHEAILKSLLIRRLNGACARFYSNNFDNFKNIQNSILKSDKKAPGEYKLSVNLGNKEYTDSEYRFIKEIFIAYLGLFFGVFLTQQEQVNFNLLRSKGDKVYFMKYVLQESKTSKMINSIINEDFITAKNNLSELIKMKVNSKVNGIPIIEI